MCGLLSGILDGFSSARNRATGVEIARTGQREEIRADSEVHRWVRHDLPLGLGLQDHPLAMMCWYTTQKA
jgi:hypothetical protein